MVTHSQMSIILDLDKTGSKGNKEIASKEYKFTLGG